MTKIIEHVLELDTELIICSSPCSTGNRLKHEKIYMHNFVCVCDKQDRIVNTQ